MKIRCHLTHAETDYLLTYPEENLFTEADEAKFLKASEESANAIEIGAFVNGKVVGSAGIEPLGDKEKLRHRADFGIAVAGKTGTAETYENGEAFDNGLFIAFAPFENPEIVICVVGEGAGHGAYVAPVVRDMLDEFFTADKVENVDAVPAENTLLR